MDYKIICLHLPNALFSYIIFFIHAVLSFFYFLFGFFNSNIYFFLNILGLVAVFNSLSTGFFWGWSQWGYIPFNDFKIAIMFILFLLFYTSIFVTYFCLLNAFYLCSYTLYVLYHIPILKYNVFWFSEIHQSATLYLLDIYMSSSTVQLMVVHACIYIYIYTSVSLLHSINVVVLF